MSVDTSTTIFPEAEIVPAGHEFSDDDLIRLGNTTNVIVTAALADREILDETLDYWYSLLEMYSPPRNTPWPNASNVFIPIVPTHYETLAAQVAQQVFMQRLFLVVPNTPQASAITHQIEYYYNAKSQKLDLLEVFEQWKNLGLRDGLSLLEVLYRHTTTRQKIVVFEDELNPATGLPLVDLRTHKKIRKPKTYTVEVDDYRDVEMTPVELRDFIISPAWQTDIEAAHMVGRKVYLDENTLRAMVADGTLIHEKVQRALNFIYGGTSDLPSDPQGDVTYNIGGKIQIGAEEGMTDAGLGQMRGSLEVWRIHSKQFVWDPDEQKKVPRETVYWWHYNSQLVLGEPKPYEYGHGKRPFIPFAPLPRPRRLYGWSLIERLAPIQAEVNQLYNGRNDIVDLITRPPMYQRTGAKVITPEGKPWHPGVLWEVQDPTDVGFVGGNSRMVDLAPSVQQEDRLMSWASLLSGAVPNLSGSVNSGRRTAREISSANSSASVRVGFISQRLRNAIGKAFWQWHQLQIQYGKDEENVAGNVLGMPQQMTISKEVLTQDVQLTISGSNGQLDQDARAQQALQTFLLLKDDPDIAQDPIKRYRLKAYLLEAQNNTNIIALLGTEQDAEKKAQEQAQFQQAVEQLAKMGVQLQGAGVPGGQPPPGGGGGKPPVAPGQLVAG